MAFPELINAVSPADADNPAAGAAQIRALKLFIEDLLGLTDNTNYTVNGISISTTGVVTFSIAPLISTLTASKPVFTDGSKNLTSAGTLGADQGGTGLGTYTTGDLLYASAVSTLAKLSVVANAKIFGNAAGTAPEFSSGVKVGVLTRDVSLANADVPYTGVTFKPSVVIFLLCQGSAPSASVGFDDGTNHFCMYNYYVTVPGDWSPVTFSIYGLHSTGNLYFAFIKSMDNDGFTLTWAKTGSPIGSATVYYLAFR